MPRRKLIEAIQDMLEADRDGCSMAWLHGYYDDVPRAVDYIGDEYVRNLIDDAEACVGEKAGGEELRIMLAGNNRAAGLLRLAVKRAYQTGFGIGANVQYHNDEAMRLARALGEV